MAKGIVQNVKKKAKKAVAAILSAAMLITMVGGVEIVRGQEADFCMREGASVRINANTGIRFAVEISGNTKEILFDSNKLKENVEVGMIIVPGDILDSVSDTTGDTNYFEKIQEKYGKTKEQIATQFSNSQFRTENGKTVATAAIVNIKDINYARTYQAVAYYTLDKGETYVYTEKSDKRTIGFVADKALADTTDYTDDLAKTVGSLLEKYISVNNDCDMSCELINGEKLDLFSTYAKGLDNSNQFKFSVKNKSDKLKIDGTEIKAEKEGKATVTMEGYEGMIDFEIPVTVGKSYKAEFIAANAYYSANSNIKATMYTREQIDSYEGNIPLTIGGRVAQIKASVTFTEDEWKSGGVVTLYTQLNMTKSRIKELLDAGYDKLVIPYYLYTDNNNGVSITGYDYKPWNTAEREKWSEFIYSLQYVYDYYDKLNGTGREDFLLRLYPSSAGTYELYIGDCEVTTSKSISMPEVIETENLIGSALPITSNTKSVRNATNSNIDWSMFSSITAKYSSILGELSLETLTDNVEPITGDEVVYKASKDITSKYTKGGSIKLYTPLAVKKTDIERWIEEGYEKLEIPYFIQLGTNENYGVHTYAMDKKQYSESVSTGVWNVARLDLEYIYKNFDRICDAKGDNYLLRIELKKAGKYTIYLGDCKPMADAAVTLNNGVCLGWVDPTAYNGAVDYEVSTSNYVKENLLIDNKTAKWCTKISIPSSVWNSNENAIQALIKPEFSKEKAIEWKNAGYSSVSIPYYIRSNETGNYSFVSDYDWKTLSAVANKWSTIVIPLDCIIDKYDNFTSSWSFALYIPNYGDYEIYFGEGEVVADSLNSKENLAQLVNPGTIYYWGSDGECSGSYTTNVTVAGRVAESYAIIEAKGFAGVISYYYTLNFDKSQIQEWIDAGYTDFKIPYYLEGNVSEIYGQYDDTYETALQWTNYMHAEAQTGVWTECYIPLENLLIRYDAIQNPGGEKYLFRIKPTAAGTVKLAIGQCGVYKEGTEETKAVATYTDSAVVTTKNIVTDSIANYDILIPKNAGSYVKTAAEELQHFIYESTKATLNIVTKAKGNYISLGNTKELSNVGLSVAKAVKGTEGYQIKTVGDNVYIYADKDLGVVYGVYGYLERTLNYDYFYKDVFTIDKSETAMLYNLDVTDVPDFATRIAGYSVTDENGWLYDSKERLRVRMETYIENMTGALGLNSSGDQVAYSFHNSLNYLPESEYGTENPKWYYHIEKDNKTLTQLCFNANGDTDSREQMEDIVAGKMFETLTTTKYKNYDKIVFAAVEDNEEWCDCDACKKDLASYGAKSASVVRFCNNVAVKVENMLRVAKDSRAETFKLVFYAYNAAEEAPVLTSTDAKGNTSYSYRPEMKLNYHVTPLYAPINADFSRSFKADTNKAYYESLKKWNMIANEVYMESYDSFFNNRGYLLPYNSWDSLSDLYKTAYENGVTWMYNLGQENNSVSSGFSLLKVYLETKLSWDVNADVSALTDKFFKAVYGEEADTVKGVYNSIKTHMNGLTAENFWPQVNSTDRNNDGHFNVLGKTLIGTIDNDNPEVENWEKTELVNWYNTLLSAEQSLESANPQAAKFVRLEEMNVISLLMECYYIKIDSTEITGTIKRKYNTSDSDFKKYRNKIKEIVEEWQIKNAAENDWAMEDYLTGLNN